MKCTNCQEEWMPPQNVSLSKCPFCQTNILQALNTKTEELSPEEILRNLLQKCRFLIESNSLKVINELKLTE